MRYLLSRLEVTEKRPVWSVETVPVSLIVSKKTWWDRTGGSCWLGRTIGDGEIEGLVDRMFFRSRLRFLFAVASNLGRFFCTSLDVRPVQVEKYPASMALVLV